MNKDRLITYWRNFFGDLFVGTFLRIFLFSTAGLVLAMAGLYGLDLIMLEPLEWSTWVEWVVLVLGFFWFAAFGLLHAMLDCALFTTSKKLAEVAMGLHDLLDLLTRGMIEKYPRIHKNIPRQELERTFDNLGRDFLEKLRLKKGIGALVARLLYGIILKTLKFFFLDDVVVELSKKTEGDITSSDIEHAVRRVGADLILAPIIENFLLLRILNYGLIIISFGIPFGVLYLF